MGRSGSVDGSKVQNAISALNTEIERHGQQARGSENWRFLLSLLPSWHLGAGVG